MNISAREEPVAKRAGISFNTFVKHARTFVGGELCKWRSEGREVRGPITKVQKKGNAVIVTCAWLAAHFPKSKKRKKWRIVHNRPIEITTGGLMGYSYLSFKRYAEGPCLSASAGVPFLGGWGVDLRNEVTVRRSHVRGL